MSVPARWGTRRSGALAADAATGGERLGVAFGTQRRDHDDQDCHSGEAHCHWSDMSGQGGV